MKNIDKNGNVRISKAPVMNHTFEYMYIHIQIQTYLI